MSANQALLETEIILPITRSSIFGRYIPVNGITLTLSPKISDNPVQVDMIRFPSNMTFSLSRRGDVVITSPGTTYRFFDSNFFNFDHPVDFEFFPQG